MACLLQADLSSAVQRNQINDCGLHVESKDILKHTIHKADCCWQGSTGETAVIQSGLKASSHSQVSEGSLLIFWLEAIDACDIHQKKGLLAFIKSRACLLGALKMTVPLPRTEVHTNTVAPLQCGQLQSAQSV